jgi:uncharacterized phiE125 gp8 family phage protein
MSVATEAPPALPAALAEVKAYLRISVSDEDALLAGLIRAAADLCEAFTGRALIDRAVEEMVAASTARTRLGAGPARAITGLATIDATGAATALAEDAFASGIDAGGGGWVRLTSAVDTARLRVSYRIGMAADWNGVPEMLRHGIVRLAAQYYWQREQEGNGAVPAAVTALWRPWRQLRLG